VLIVVVFVCDDETGSKGERFVPNDGVVGAGMGVAVDAGICIGVEVDVAIGLGAGAGIPVVIGIGVAVPMTKCENGVDGMLADEFDG
jgi:hypothetical protein